MQTLHGSWVVYVMDRFICRDDRYIILIKSDVVLTTRCSDFATNFGATTQITSTPIEAKGKLLV